MELEKLFQTLRDPGHPVAVSQLILLSDLSPREIKLFRDSWERMPPERRREVVSHLVLLATDNIEMNFDELFKACLEDSDARVLVKCLDGLGECEDPRLIAPLVKMLQQDREESIREAAARSLGKFALLAEYRELRPGYAEQVKKALLTIIASPQESVEVRRCALESISVFSIPEVKEAIQEAYYGEEDLLRISALIAMGRNCDLCWLPILLQEMESTDLEMRLGAVIACGELGEEETVSYLQRLLETEADFQIQLACIKSLGQIGGVAAKRALRPWLSHPAERIRQATEAAWEEAEFTENLIGL